MGRVIDLSTIEGPVVDDVSGDYRKLDMAEQPEIVHAALNALESMDLRNSSISAYEFEGEINLKNIMTAYEDGGGRVELNDGTVIENAQSHLIGLQVDINEMDNGNYKIDVRVDHMGSYEQGVNDARTTLMNYEVTPEGQFVDRGGHAIAHDDAANQWTIDAAQTFEHRLATMLGENSMESLMEKRPEGASVNAGEPPIDANMNSLNSIVNGMGADNTTEMKVSVDPLSPG